MTEYMYAGVCNDTGSRLFRTTDGATWVETTTGEEEFNDHWQCSWAVLDGAIYCMFGQTSQADGNTATPHVFRSLDGGFNFTKLADFPGTARAELGRLLPVFGGKIHVVHGGRYSSPGEIIAVYDDHWTFDGTTWVEVEAHTAPVGAIWETLWSDANDLYLKGGMCLIPGSSYRNQRTLWRWNAIAGWRPAVVPAFSHDHANSVALLANGDALVVPCDFSGNTTRIIRAS